MEIWEPKSPGTLWATPGLLWDSFFTFILSYIHANRKGIPYVFKSLGTAKIMLLCAELSDIELRSVYI